MDEQTNMPEFTEADKRETTFHNFDEHPEIEGKLLSIEDGSFGKQYVVETAAGKVTVGTYDVIKGKILISDINKNVKIKYLGQATSPTTKRTYFNFDVWVK